MDRQGRRTDKYGFAKVREYTGSLRNGNYYYIKYDSKNPNITYWVIKKLDGKYEASSCLNYDENASTIYGKFKSTDEAKRYVVEHIEKLEV